MNSKTKKNSHKTTTGTLTRIRRTPYQSAAAILTMAITLFLVGVVGLISVGSSVVLRHFERKPQVTAFFKADVNLTQDEIVVLKERLISTGKVTSVKFVSKEDALALYKDLFKEDQILLELVTAKMLPTSLEVSTSDPKFLPQVSDLLKKEPGIDQVIFQEDVVSSLTRWADALRKIGLAVIIIFSIFSVMIISVIVTLRVALRKDEIDILNLIGGSPWYIYKPFFLDSLFYGIFGGIIAWFTNVLVILYATPFLVSFLSGIPIFPIPPITYGILLFVQLTLGMGIGVFASVIALKRYLAS